MKQALILLPLLVNTLSNAVIKETQQYAWDSEENYTYSWNNQIGNEYYTIVEVSPMYDEEERPMDWRGNQYSVIVYDGSSVISDSVQINIYYWYNTGFQDLHLTEIETSYNPQANTTVKLQSAFFKQGFANYIDLQSFNMTTIGNMVSAFVNEDKYMSREMYLPNPLLSNTINYQYSDEVNDLNEYSYYVEIYTLNFDSVNPNVQTTATLMNESTQTYKGYKLVNIPPNIEVIDLSSMLLDILMMPWAFLSVAFNFTLWPGTPYAINLSHIATVFLGTLVLIFLIKLLLKYIR